MEPTAEQLIRDYLNRLSVAARTRLRSDDRRAFLARTREFLERRSAEPGADDDGGVLDALATLGEPVAAVENEYARLAAERRKRAATRSGLWRPRGSRAGEPEASAGDADAGPDSDAGPGPGQAPAPAPGSRRTPTPRHLPRAAVDVSHLDAGKLKGDIEKKVKVNRPLSSRWRPGAPMSERPVRSYRVPRPRAGGSQPGKANGAGSPGPGTGRQRAGSPAPGTEDPAPRPASSQAAPGAVGPQVAGSQPAGSRAGAADDLQGDGSRPEVAAADDQSPAGAQSSASQTGPGTLAGPQQAGTSPAGPHPSGPSAMDLRPADPAPGAQPPADPASPTLASGGGSPAGVLPEDWLSESRPGAAAPGAATPEPVSPEAGGPAAASPGSDKGTTGSAARPAGGVRASVTRPARVVTSRLPPVQLPELSDVGRGIAARVVRFTRQHRLETAAIALMILCGLIYPVFSWVLGFSLWLLGAILAAASKQWSLWEKWAGLLGPVVLVIAGTSVGLALGGHHHTLAPYVHEVLADSRIMIKISAVLGGVYLAWRAHRGPSYSAPPWHR
jgi:uncharacterized small protein (DUF1192 family)